jgi:hypothetical protein
MTSHCCLLKETDMETDTIKNGRYRHVSEQALTIAWLRIEGLSLLSLSPSGLSFADPTSDPRRTGMILLSYLPTFSHSSKGRVFRLVLCFFHILNLFRMHALKSIEYQK